MDEVIKRLLKKCKEIEFKTIAKKDYDEVLELIENHECSSATKLSLLVEMHRFAYYNSVIISLDPRGDWRFKLDFTNLVKTHLNENNINDELINELKEKNDYMRSKIDDPVKSIQEAIEFYTENPGAKF